LITLALPTGALLDDSLALLRAAGVVDLSRAELGRKLLVEKSGLRCVLVRPADVAAYVEHGSADLGIAGKDQLWEAPPGHYELVDLRFGACVMIVAVPEASALGAPGTWPPSLRLATKYPLATQRYMQALGQTVDLVHLHGSIELAPLLGLVDGIVDLMQSGRTLRENHLRVVATVGRSTARLIANQASLKTRSEPVQHLVSRLRQSVES